MIIESGFGLHLYLFHDSTDRESWELRIACLDERLQPVHFGRLAEKFEGSLDVHADAIRDAVRRESVRYFAVGHRVADCYPGRDLDEFYDSERLVVAELEAEGFTFLGQQTHDTDGWSSSGPMHRFESYVDGDKFPRVLVIPPPHPFAECACAACGPRNARWAAARAENPRATS